MFVSYSVNGCDNSLAMLIARLGAYDWGNETINYQLEFRIKKDFVAELEDTRTDIYRWYNETIGHLASV